MNNDPKIVFIFSLPRAGSTLLQRMLATHPDVDTTSELWFLLPFVYTLKSQGVFAQYSHVSLSNAMDDLIRQLPNGKQDYFDSLSLFARSIYSKLSRMNCRYYIDKTPRYYLIIEEIDKIFPDAKYIFLFRNPLGILASMIDSFWGGDLGDYRHKIDAYKGPDMLSKGFRAVKSKSIAVQYEKLITQPEETIEDICNYLSIPHIRGADSSFKNIFFEGSMGDFIGTKSYSKVEKFPLEKWKKTFGTKYRKKYALKYLKYLGKDTISTFGYDYDKLISELNMLKVKNTGGIRDRYQLFFGNLRILLEIPMMRKKLRDWKNFERKLYIHY